MSPRVTYAEGPVKESFDLSVVLVRPDGIVAYADEGEPVLAEVAKAAARWFVIGEEGRA